MARATLAIALAATATTLGACSNAGDGDEGVTEEADGISANVCPDGVPAALNPPADETIKSRFNGVGVQIYICTPTATGYAWTLFGPQANLLTDGGKLVGTHFFGPSWQGNDASSVVGKKLAGVTVDPTAVPWLLLTAVSHAEAKGMFSDVTSIQRLATVGGVAPATGCDATTVASVVQVPYSTEYVFYKKTDGRVTQCKGE